MIKDGHRTTPPSMQGQAQVALLQPSQPQALTLEGVIFDSREAHGTCLAYFSRGGALAKEGRYS